MYAIRNATPVGTRDLGEGRFVLSRGSEVIRKRAGKIWGGETIPIHPDFIQQTLSPSPGNRLVRTARRFLPDFLERRLRKDAILAVSRKFVPYETAMWFELAGLSEDLKALCADVVFCAYLYAGQPPQWARYLIPHQLSEAEIKLLAGDDFLPYPYHTIFINFFNPEGNPLKQFDLFRLMVYPLGYLKYMAELKLKRINPDSVPHVQRHYFAARYEHEAAESLRRNLARQNPVNHQALRAVTQVWLPDAAEQLRIAQSGLDTLNS